MNELLHIKYIRLSDNEENSVVRSVNVSKRTLSLIRQIPWVEIKSVEKCDRKVKQDFLLK